MWCVSFIEVAFKSQVPWCRSQMGLLPVFEKFEGLKLSSRWRPPPPCLCPPCPPCRRTVSPSPASATDYTRYPACSVSLLNFFAPPLMSVLLPSFQQHPTWSSSSPSPATSCSASSPHRRPPPSPRPHRRRWRRRWAGCRPWSPGWWRTRQASNSAPCSARPWASSSSTTSTCGSPTSCSSCPSSPPTWSTCCPSFCTSLSLFRWDHVFHQKVEWKIQIQIQMQIQIHGRWRLLETCSPFLRSIFIASTHTLAGRSP